MPKPLQITGPIPTILNTLQILQRQDKEVERKIRIFSGISIAGWVLVVISGFIAIQSAMPALLTIPTLLAIGSIFTSIMWYRNNQENIEDRRLTAPEKFLYFLGHDIPKKGKCSLQLNFDGYLKHGKLAANTGGGFFGGVREKNYSDNWFVSKGTLCDGSIFRVSIEQDVKRKEKSKRKYTKINERFTEKVTLSLRVSPEAYPEWSKLSQLLQPGKLPRLTITRVVVDNATIRVTGVTDAAFLLRGRGSAVSRGEENLTDGDTLLQLFVFTYAQLQQCMGRQPRIA